jgi:hypothetical protein
MKQILLATALIALPVAAFTAFEVFLAPAAPTVAATADPLGDLSALKAIVADVQTIAVSGDFTKAEARITDFETAWDDAESSMRPLDTMAWGNVDEAADTALTALRAGSPVADEVTAALTGLASALDNPAGTGPAASGGVTLISGIAVTDAAGRAIPCETLLAQLADGLAASTLADKTAVTDLQAKALERCNADDDTRADGFTAQALGLLAAQ